MGNTVSSELFSKAFFFGFSHAFFLLSFIALFINFGSFDFSSKHFISFDINFDEFIDGDLIIMILVHSLKDLIGYSSIKSGATFLIQIIVKFFFTNPLIMVDIDSSEFLLKSSDFFHEFFFGLGIHRFHR